jgi:hypothetical protein
MKKVLQYHIVQCKTAMYNSNAIIVPLLYLESKLDSRSCSFTSISFLTKRKKKVYIFAEGVEFYFGYSFKQLYYDHKVDIKCMFCAVK